MYLRAQIIFLFILSTTSSQVFAQSETNTFQTWTDVNLNYSLNNKITLGGDIGLRGMVSRNNWNQFYVRPTFRLFFNRTVRMSMGVAYFFTSSDIVQNVRELRFFQQVIITWPKFEYIAIKHRVRLEERFFAYGDQIVLNTPRSDKEIRSRYQIGLESADFKLFKENNYLYFLTNFEAFFHFDDFAFEQSINNTRTTLGFGHRIGSSFRYELNYIFQNSRLLTKDGVATTENILRIRFFVLGRDKKSKQKE